nr:hypothetical protein [Mobiluncus mulieris]
MCGGGGIVRELKPCGTPAAYRRHKRHHEPPCEACREAVAKYKRGRRQVRKRLEAAPVVLAVAEAAPLPDEIDAVSDARENLRIVTAAMAAAPPQALAGLSRRRQELVDFIAGATKSEEGGSLSEQLAALRNRNTDPENRESA